VEVVYFTGLSLEWPGCPQVWLTAGWLPRWFVAIGGWFPGQVVGQSLIFMCGLAIICIWSVFQLTQTIHRETKFFSLASDPKHQYLWPFLQLKDWPASASSIVSLVSVYVCEQRTCPRHSGKSAKKKKKKKNPQDRSCSLLNHNLVPHGTPLVGHEPFFQGWRPNPSVTYTDLEISVLCTAL
jgi:hypothetical protein